MNPTLSESKSPPTLVLILERDARGEPTIALALESPLPIPRLVNGDGELMLPAGSRLTFGGQLAAHLPDRIRRWALTTLAFLVGCRPGSNGMLGCGLACRAMLRALNVDVPVTFDEWDLMAVRRLTRIAGDLDRLTPIDREVRAQRGEMAHAH